MDGNELGWNNKPVHTVPVIAAGKTSGFVYVKAGLKEGARVMNTRTQTIPSSLVLAKYLPWDLLLRHGETCDFAAWVVQLSGVHMVLVLFLCPIDGLAGSLIGTESCRQE